MHGIPKGKIIRDAVHGDIFVEDISTIKNCSTKR